jgi:filamin
VRFIVSGSGKPSDIAQSSSLFVETIEKKPGATKAKRFHGDANRVVAQGNGLKKGFCGRPATFTLDTKDAGEQSC